MPNRGLVLGVRLTVAGRLSGGPDAAGRKGDPQWHAGDDPLFEEACVFRGCTANVSAGYGTVKTCYAALKHGEALCAV